MSLNFTPFARPGFVRLARRTDSWSSDSEDLQRTVLYRLLQKGKHTEYGREYGFEDILRHNDVAKAFAERVPMVEFEDIRPYVIRMVKGEGDVLWPGVCKNFAQSSGTSGGKSKYIPITADSLKGNHYAGGADVVAHYLRQVSHSKLFSGKSFILGGSFSNTLDFEVPKGVCVGDLSATLINRINPFVNFFRIPDKQTALMPDWEEKLPALVKAAEFADVTNISGVPSWFLTVIRKVCETRGADKISDVWPNLEVFFHGGISFDPYREEYRKLTDPSKMHFQETYNASEGFFAVQNDFSDKGMLLIIDRDVFYEFIPLNGADKTPRPLWELTPGEVYEMVITASNGLWRYRLGDTVRVTQTNPVKITIAGRTKCFINAFGEELMEDNAEKAIAAACAQTGASILNYTAAPLYAAGGHRGRHQWLIEWGKRPDDMDGFAAILDAELRKVNSDYDAKRAHTIFLDPLEVISVPTGMFDKWLKEAGSHKLGGQRKVPRLANDRHIVDRLLEMLKA